MLTNSLSAIVVQWIDNTLLLQAAKDKGWTEEGNVDLTDVVDVDLFIKVREFPNLTRAKSWARRNRARDLWSQPCIVFFRWPDSRRLSWQRETTRRLRYVGDGLGWEETG